MKNATQAKSSEFDLLKQRIADLEKRMMRIEEDVTASGFHRTGLFRAQQVAGDESGQIIDKPGDDSMESKIGEYGDAFIIRLKPNVLVESISEAYNSSARTFFLSNRRSFVRDELRISARSGPPSSG